MRTSNKGLIVALYFLAFIVYCIICFLGIGSEGNAFWIAFAFSFLAFLVQSILWFLLFAQGRNDSKDFLEIPLVYIGGIFYIIQLFIGLMLSAIKDIGVNIVWIIEVIIFICGIGGLIVAFLSRNVISKHEDYIDTKVGYIRGLCSKLTLLQNKVDDAEIQKKVENLKELIQYSDPVSSVEIRGLEAEIEEDIDGLVYLAKNGKKDEMKELIVRIQQLVEDRNEKCKLLK